MKYSFTSITKIRTLGSVKCCRGSARTDIWLHCGWSGRLVQEFWREVWHALRANNFSTVYLLENIITPKRDICAIYTYITIPR